MFFHYIRYVAIPAQPNRPFGTVLWGPVEPSTAMNRGSDFKRRRLSPKEEVKEEPEDGGVKVEEGIVAVKVETVVSTDSEEEPPADLPGPPPLVAEAAVDAPGARAGGMPAEEGWPVGKGWRFPDSLTVRWCFRCHHQAYFRKGWCFNCGWTHRTPAWQQRRYYR